METKSPKVNGQDKSKLPPLPEDNDPFWEHAEKIPIKPEPVHPDCAHYFILVKAREAQCKFCSWGIFLGFQDRIEDGHLIQVDKTII